MRPLILILSIVILGITACKKDNPDPSIAVLVFPDKDAACTVGEAVSATHSSILFTWNSSDNTDLYELYLKNLVTGISTSQSTSKTELQITLLKNTPYSWYILSKSESTNTTTQSDVWKFYNAGPGTVSYAPFPAEIVSPIMGQIISAAGGKIILDWNGSDVDNDIVSYDVYFSASTAPALLKGNLTESILHDVSVTSGTTYFWKIITKDSKGNTSDSGVYQVKIN